MSLTNVRRWCAAAATLLAGSSIATAATEGNAPADPTILSCSRSMSCVIASADRAPCPEEIGGARTYRDNPRFLIDTAGEEATLAGGPTYVLQVTAMSYRLWRRKVFPFASVVWESLIDRATGALSGQTRITFSKPPRVVEFRYSGICSLPAK